MDTNEERQKGHSGSHSPNPGFNDPLTTAPAQGAEERHARIRKGLTLNGTVHIPEWGPEVTDPEVEKFLEWLPLKLGHDSSEVRKRLLRLIEMEGISAAHVTAAKDAEIERLKRALAQYGTHKSNCKFYQIRANVRCTCGLRVALGTEASHES